ncbi:MAG: hypothetical protein NT001_01105 [Candidatus Woesearchaeota archaeon]|nr:hypothetical protein [Candidatus Woesearchaeota archaeon]
MKSKSQSSMEFIILAGFMFLFFVGFAAVIGTKMIDFQEILNTRQVQDIMDVIKTEIQLAATSMDGYQRSFYLPETLDGKNYTLGLRNENTLMILYNGKIYESFLPGAINPDTTIYKGKNAIIKSLGEIFITSSDPCRWLDAGADSYCLGGTCYCNSGFYDSHCNESSYPPEINDGVLEDDFVVDHCGNTTQLANPRIPTIGCVAIDPCNIPPKFTAGPAVDLPQLERGATISFSSNERLSSVVVYYAQVDTPSECYASTTFTGSQEFGPYYTFPAQVTLAGLKSATTYCFNVTIIDSKEGKASSAPMTFTTTEDITPPFIRSEDITITPEKIYLGTEFTIQATIDEPSGLDKANIIINSTAGNENITKSAIDDSNVEYNPESGILNVHFTVQDDFIDRNASVIYNPQNMLFYNRFDNPLSFDAEQASGSRTATIGGGSPASVKGRFSNGVEIGLGDELLYPASGNIDLSKGTIEFWINTTWDSYDAGTYYLFDEGTEGSQRISLLKAGNKLYFSVYHLGTSYPVSVPINTFWNAGSWYFIAATWDSAKGEIALYINSTQKNSRNSVPALSSLSPSFAIGSSLYNTGYEADAVMDHFIIFNEARTQEQIASDMIKEREYSIDFDLQDSSDRKNEAYYPIKKTFSVNYSEKPED